MRTLLKVERGTIVHFAKWVGVFLILIAIALLVVCALGSANISIPMDGAIPSGPATPH
jgi:hypothetical protein